MWSSPSGLAKCLTYIDRVLLRLPDILLHIYDVSCSFRVFVLDLVAPLLLDLCNCEWTLVCGVRRMVEASGI